MDKKEFNKMNKLIGIKESDSFVTKMSKIVKYWKNNPLPVDPEDNWGLVTCKNCLK